MSFTTPRAAIMATFAAFGAMVGTFAGSVPQIIANYGLDNASYGIGVTIMTAATVVTMGFAGMMARHFSHRSLLLVLLPLVLSLNWLLLTGNTALIFFVSIVLYGAASGALDMIMNAEGGLIEHELKRPVYTAFHGAVSLSVAFFAITSSILSTNYGTWASMLVATLLVAVTILMVWRNVPIRALSPRRQRHEKRSPLFSAFTLPSSSWVWLQD